MNLKLPCLALALLSVAATGDSNSCTGNSTGTSGVPNYGPQGSVCSDLGVACCGNVNDPCSDNTDCCTGNCSGSNGDGGAGSPTDGAGGACAEPVNEGCTVGLTSRCSQGACQCTTDTDCCLGNCLEATIPGTTGKRCCLETGSPCDISADCCSLTCQDSGQCE
jgi:hypothetical protein